MPGDNDPTAVCIEHARAVQFGPSVAARIPEELMDAIDAVAALHGANRSDVIRAALEAFAPIRAALQEPD